MSKLVKAIMVGGVGLAFTCLVAATSKPANTGPLPDMSQLPPAGTLILEPIALDRIVIWVPSNRTGPIINQSCQTQDLCSCSYVLAPDIKHTKASSCLPQVARVLAEYMAGYCEKDLPLALFDGWRWECPVDLCQYESFTYQLLRHGGSWENSMEAVFDLSSGTLEYQWLNGPQGDDAGTARERLESHIDASTFSQMRTRDGYPKTPIFW